MPSHVIHGKKPTLPRRFSKITPLRRSIGYGQRRYREAAKKRSFAKAD
jgi:hypothetical protein